MVPCLGALAPIACDRGEDPTPTPAVEDEPELVGEPYEGEYTHAFADHREYYSESFTEADDKFVQACGHAGGRLEYFDHLMHGKDGEPLRAVICHQDPGDAGKVVVTLSGTHGVEGFAGSAMQVGVLMNPDTLALPAGWRAVHVHMINPYGASWVLKENEDNADALKNYAALYDQEIDNPILVEFIDRLNMPAWGDPEAQMAAMGVLPALMAEHGPEQVQHSLITGQGDRPFGIAYFGHGKSWSTGVLETMTQTYLTEAEQIVLLDFHTAVGDYGTWTVLSSEPQSQEQLARWLQGTGAPVLLQEVPSGAEPFFEPVRKPSGAPIVRALVEAGTYPADDYQLYFVLNLYCRFFAGGWESDACAFTRQEIGEYFYPKGDDWKDSTWQTFVPMWQGLMTGMAEMTESPG